MSTVADIITRLRLRIDEPTANKWSSAQLVYYVADAEQWLRNLLVKIPGSGRFRVRDTFTLSANAETYTVSSLSHRFGEVIELQMLSGGSWITLNTLPDGIDDAYLRNIAGATIPEYRLIGETFQFLPTSQSARSMALIQRYKPTIKTSTGDTIETPTDYDGDLANRAAHFALADAGLTNKAFDEEYAARIAEIEAIESQRFQGANTERIRRRSTRRMFLCR